VAKVRKRRFYRYAETVCQVIVFIPEGQKTPREKGDGGRNYVAPGARKSCCAVGALQVKLATADSDIIPGVVLRKMVNRPRKIWDIGRRRGLEPQNNAINLLSVNSPRGSKGEKRKPP